MRFDYCEYCKYLEAGECVYNPEIHPEDPRCVREMIDRMVKEMEEEDEVVR